MITKFKFYTALPTYNDITHWSYAKRSDGYYKAKRNSEALLANELKTIPGNVKSLSEALKKGLNEATSIKARYIWHTTHGYDLSNLSFGTKFIEDTLNTHDIWLDDKYITGIKHDLIKDTSDYVEVILSY